MFYLFFITKNLMNLANKQRFWKYYLKFKRCVRFIYEISSFVILLLSFENACKLKNWSVVKPWQIARLTEKFPKICNLIIKTFATA